MSALPAEAWGAALAALPGIGPSQLAALLDGRSPEDAWAAVQAGAAGARWAAAAAATDVGELWGRLCTLGARVALLGAADYPAALAGDHAAPRVLFVLGDAAVLDDRARVALVGTRRCSAAGRDLACRLGRELAEAGVVVISGLALGIDGAAHAGVLAAPGGAPPVAVVGSGLDVVYPARHRELWRRVAERGALLGEAPLGARPEPWRFPARNRILAALAHSVVVVESGAGGGSMHTVRQALARSREVLAVPGAVANPAAAGTNTLLVEGATPVRDATDVLVNLALTCPVKVVTPRRGREQAPAPAGDDPVLAAVDWAPTATETVLARTGLAPPAAAVALARLERDGLVRGVAGWWERVGG